jgi:hypothetical protein
LLQLDLLHEGTVLATGVKIHIYLTPPQVQEEAHVLLDVASANIPVLARHTYTVKYNYHIGGIGHDDG